MGLKTVAGLALALVMALPIPFAVAAQEQAQVKDAAAGAATPAQGIGTLVVEIKDFSGEKTLPAKVERQLKSGGIEWGQRDKQIVFTMVNKQFIDFPVNHMTRYGQSESVLLPAGDYSITGIGLEMSAGFSVQKILDRGAFVNPDAMTLRIEPGKTTKLVINPVIYKDNAFVVNFWVPTLNASVINEGVPETTPVSLNTRTDRSIAWPQYSGPLKFVAK